MNFDRNRFYNVESPDRAEMMENRKYKIAMTLFRKISEDFLTDKFTEKEIKENYNESFRKKGRGTQYGKAHLSYLVEKGLLIYNKEEKTYSIDHGSSAVAKILEGEEEDEE